MTPACAGSPPFSVASTNASPAPLRTPASRDARLSSPIRQTSPSLPAAATASIGWRSCRTRSASSVRRRANCSEIRRRHAPCTPGATSRIAPPAAIARAVPIATTRADSISPRGTATRRPRPAFTRWPAAVPGASPPSAPSIATNAARSSPPSARNAPALAPDPCPATFSICNSGAWAAPPRPGHATSTHAKTSSAAFCENRQAACSRCSGRSANACACWQRSSAHGQPYAATGSTGRTATSNAAAINALV